MFGKLAENKKMNYFSAKYKGRGKDLSIEGGGWEPLGMIINIIMAISHYLPLLVCIFVIILTEDTRNMINYMQNVQHNISW